MEEKKWYLRTPWIILFLLVLWPLGLIFMWKSDWAFAAKIIVTIVLALFVIGSYWALFAVDQNVAWMASL